MSEVLAPIKAASDFSNEDRKRLCAAWQKTKMSRSAFMRQHRLPKAFHNWCNQLIPQQESEQTVKAKSEGKIKTKAGTSWLPVVASQGSYCVPPEFEASTPSSLIKAQLHCNELKLDFLLQIEQLITLIKELPYAAAVIR